MENCLKTQLKGTVNFDGEFFEKAKIHITSSSQPNEHIAVKGVTKIKVLGNQGGISLTPGGNYVSELTLNPEDPEDLSSRNYVYFTPSSDMDLLIYNKYNLVLLIGMSMGSSRGSFDINQLAYNSVFKVFNVQGHINLFGDLVSMSWAIESQTLRLTGSDVTGSINELAEGQISNNRNYETNQRLSVFCSGKNTVTKNDGTIITPVSDREIMIVFKNGGYELYLAIDGEPQNLLYDSLA